MATARVHHLNCISTCPLGGRLTDGISDCVLCRARLSCHCLLLETAAGLVLLGLAQGFVTLALAWAVLGVGMALAFIIPPSPPSPVFTDAPPARRSPASP